MFNLRNLVILIAAILIGFIGYFIYGYVNANDMTKRLRQDKPLGIRIALVNEEKDDALEMLLQMVVYPGQKRFVLFFQNTDAYLEAEDDKPLRNKSPSSGDDFSDYTGVKSHYYITLKRKAAVRLLDILEGAPVFLEKPLLLEAAEFQYPQGTQRFSGEQVLEYITALDVRIKKEDPLLAGIDRSFRQESLLLNLFWRIRSFKEKLKSRQLREFTAGLVDSNMSYEEISDLFAFMASDIHSSVLDVPMKAVALKKRDPKRLVVNVEQARLTFKKFKQTLEDGQLKKKNYTVEVLNGTDSGGLARRVKQFLQDQGPLVLHAANYDYKPLYRTAILERSGNSYFAEHLSIETGTRPDRVYFRRRVLDVNITFIIGNDFSIKNLKL